MFLLVVCAIVFTIWVMVSERIKEISMRVRNRYMTTFTNLRDLSSIRWMIKKLAMCLKSFSIYKFIRNIKMLDTRYMYHAVV